ncbi:MAG: hypothetical protein PUE71_07220, partial [Clostridia bacterium]|nr:hypothetical protein [Clostridia bacterium]
AGASSAEGDTNNSGTATGGDGGKSQSGNGGNGGAGTSSDKGNTDNSGTATGGNGGDSTEGIAGNGGAGASAGNNAVNTEEGTSTGGDGGKSQSGDGGNGGAGVSSDKGSTDNSGAAKGGLGGDSTEGNGGNGGAGASSVEGDTNNSGTTTGGDGGKSQSGNGGNGGAGVSSDKGNTDNSGNSTGGNGGDSESGNGGNGGAGINTETGNIKVNGSQTTGGNGGKGQTGGKGGNGINADGSDVIVENNATTTGGNGGEGFYDNGGDGGNAINTSAGNVYVDRTSTVAGGNGGKGDNAGGRGGVPVVSGGDIQNAGNNVWGEEGHYVALKEDSDDKEIKPDKPVQIPDIIIEPSKPEEEHQDEALSSEEKTEETKEGKIEGITISMGGESITSNELLENVSEVEIKDNSILASRGMSIEDAVVQIADAKKREELITASVNESILKVSVENINEKVVKGSFKDRKQVVEAVMTPEELVHVLAGTQLEIRLSITPVQDENVNAQMKTMLNEKQYQIGASLDISLYKIINNTQKQKITNTKEPISFVLDIPDNLIKQNRVFSLLVEHETASGDLEYFYLEDTDTDDKTITCVTDKLCEVILTYKDGDVQNVKEPESVSDSKTEVKEDDETITNPEKPELSEILKQKQSFIVLWILLAILVFTGIMMLIIRYRRNKNRHD